LLWVLSSSFVCFVIVLVLLVLSSLLGVCSCWCYRSVAWWVLPRRGIVSVAMAWRGVLVVAVARRGVLVVAAAWRGKYCRGMAW